MAIEKALEYRRGMNVFLWVMGDTGPSVYSISVSLPWKELKKFKTYREIIDALDTMKYMSLIEVI